MRTIRSKHFFLLLPLGIFLLVFGMQVYSWVLPSPVTELSIIANADINNDGDINNGMNHLPGTNTGEDSGVNFSPGNTIHALVAPGTYPTPEINESIIMEHQNPQGTCMYGTGLPIIAGGPIQSFLPSLFIDQAYAAPTTGTYYSTDHGQTWIEYNATDLVPTVQGCVITHFRIVNPGTYGASYQYALTTLPTYNQSILVDSVRLYAKNTDTGKEDDFVTTQYVMYPLSAPTCLTGTASLTIVDVPVSGAAGICGSASGTLVGTGWTTTVSSQTGALCVLGTASSLSVASGAVIDSSGTMVIGNVHSWTCGGSAGKFNGSSGSTTSCQAYELLPVASPTPVNTGSTHSGTTTIIIIYTGSTNTGITPPPQQPFYPIPSSGGGGGASAGGGSQTLTISPGVTVIPAGTTTGTVSSITGTVQTPTPRSTLPKKCTSIIKNLDDPRLVDYAQKIGVEDFSHTDRRLSRIEFLKIALNSIGADIHASSGTTLPFQDIDTNAWYVPYLQYALSHGIITERTEFYPDMLITRAESAKIFVKITGITNLSKTNPFADTDTTGDLKAYIATAYDNCLLHGRNTIDGIPLSWPRIFEPYDSISVGEELKVLYNEKYK